MNVEPPPEWAYKPIPERFKNMLPRRRYPGTYEILYELNQEDIMYSPEEIKRVLNALNVQTQAQLHALIDQDATAEQVLGISGIETVYAPVVVFLRSLSPDEWASVVGNVAVDYVPPEGEGGWEDHTLETEET